MAQYKFTVGQPVEYLPGKLQASAQSGEYKVTRRLPAEGGVLQYRIKNSQEPFERTAREHQLASRAPV